MKYFIEFTDTYGGEANYCWVDRYVIDNPTDTRLSLVRKVKKTVGLTGSRCEVSDFGDSLWIRPTDRPVIAFVDWFDDTNPLHTSTLESQNHDCNY